VSSPVYPTQFSPPHRSDSHTAVADDGVHVHAVRRRGAVLIKTSTSHAMFTAPGGGLSVAALITNYPLWAGLTCYGASTVLLILALGTAN